MKSLHWLLSGHVSLSSAASVRMLLSSPSAAFRTKQSLFQSDASTASLHAGAEPSSEGGSGQEGGWLGGGRSTMDGGGLLYYCTETLLPAPGHMGGVRNETPPIRRNVDFCLYNLHRVWQVLAYVYVTHISITCESQTFISHHISITKCAKLSKLILRYVKVYMHPNKFHILYM